MDRSSVDSTCVRSVGYDSVGRVLEIEFTSGTVYEFLAVPETVHRGLMSADSQGRYFNQRIRGRYHYNVIGLTTVPSAL